MSLERLSFVLVTVPTIALLVLVFYIWWTESVPAWLASLLGI